MHFVVNLTSFNLKSPQALLACLLDILLLLRCCVKSTGILISHLLKIYAATAAASLQSYPTLCDPTDGSPPGSPIPGILQARTLEWVAVSFSNA